MAWITEKRNNGLAILPAMVRLKAFEISKDPKYEIPAEEYFVVFCAENVSVCGFNDNRNYNFFLESVLKNRVRIIYGCALYTGKYGI